MNNRLSYIINMSLAALAGLSGCLVALMVIIALLAGFALDELLNSSPAFTILCIVGSVPLSLAIILIMVYRLAKTIERRQYGSK